MGNAQNAELTYEMINSGDAFTYQRLCQVASNYQITNFGQLRPVNNLVTKQAFLAAYQYEHQIREHRILDIEKQIQSYKEKRKMVSALLKAQRQNNQYNKYRINPDSKLSVSLIGTRSMEQLKSDKGILTVLCNKKQAFKSGKINLKQMDLQFDIPISLGNETIVFNIRTSKAQGVFQITLESLFDQEVHRRWYNLVKTEPYSERNMRNKNTIDLNNQTDQKEQEDKTQTCGSIKLEVQ